MSLDLLLRLQVEHSFDPAPLREDLLRYHVPFEELVPGSRVEWELDRAARAPERVAIVGPSGSGKSSVVEFVLGPTREKIAPIRVPVAAEPDETVAEPQAFARHLVRTLVKYARVASLITDDEREELLRRTSERLSRPGRETVRRLGLVPSWLLGGSLAAEVRSTGEAIEHRRSASDVIEEAAGLLELIRAHGLLPILVIDDSDSWLSVPGLEQRSRLVGAFFGRVVRTLAEYRCGLVLAVHEHYLAMAGYRAAAGFVETTIRLPALGGADALARILVQRLAAHGVADRLRESWDEAAVEELYRYYGSGAQRSLRRVMQAAHTALHHACTDGADTISRELVEAAVSEWM